MRRHVVIALALTVSTILLMQGGCQKPAEVSQEPKPALAKPTVEHGKVEPNKPAPKIAFEKLVYDYGDVGPGTDNVGEFRFTNKGSAVLQITGVKDCCGIRTSLAKRQYAPGESGVVQAKFQAFTVPGVLRREVHVYSNDPTQPDVTLAIRARIVPKVAYTPSALRLLLKDKDTAGPAITLTSLDGKPFSITNFQATGDSMTADIDPAVQATKFVLQPTIDIEKLQKGVEGGQGGRIVISLTHPECREVGIPFSALPKFKITPPQIIVLKAEPQKPVVRKVWVLSNYGEDFEVESTSSQNNIIEVLSQKKISSGYEFEVQVTPPEAKEDKRFSDVFVVNLTGGDKLTITCRGFY